MDAAKPATSCEILWSLPAECLPSWTFKDGPVRACAPDNCSTGFDQGTVPVLAFRSDFVCSSEIELAHHSTREGEKSLSLDQGETVGTGCVVEHAECTKR